jgi:hypothetical protein
MIEDIERSFHKYRAADEARDRHLSAFTQLVKAPYMAYAAAMHALDNRWHYSNDWPDGIESVSVYQDKVSVSGKRYCRGCTDSAGFSLPRDYVFGSDQGREQILADISAKAEAKLAAAEEQAKAAELAQYEALKEKFG